MKLPFMQYSPATCHFNFSQNIFLSTLFWNTLSLFSAVNMADQVSHPLKTTSKIIVLHISVFMSLYNKRNEKGFGAEWLLGVLVLLKSFRNIVVLIFY
jgi:hypothetical protein